MYSNYYFNLFIKIMSEDYVSSTSETTTNKFIKKTHLKVITFYEIEEYDNYSKERLMLEKLYSDIDFLHKARQNYIQTYNQIPVKHYLK